uniref:Fatty-acid and retinol-binding protein 1 n=1 Tax=Strongyloides venezuelensis TaxID=75913 RepID=A0A0K0F4P2_STRVS
MKFVILFFILIIAKIQADDVVVDTVNEVASKFSDVSPDVVSNFLPGVSDNFLNLFLERNNSNLISFIPKEIVETYENLSEKERMQIFKAILSLGTKAKMMKQQFTKDVAIETIKKIDSETLEKLKNLYYTLVDKGQKVSDGVKSYVKEYADFIKQKYTQYKDVKDMSEIPESEVVQAAVKLAQGYVKLTDDDRKSIGEAFETLSNFANNEKYLTILKTLNENSTAADLANVQRQISEAFLNGEFNPPN